MTIFPGALNIALCVPFAEWDCDNISRCHGRRSVQSITRQGAPRDVALAVIVAIAVMVPALILVIVQLDLEVDQEVDLGTYGWGRW